jgi:hypothetical protein
LFLSGRGQRNNLSSISRLLQQLHNGDESSTSNGHVASNPRQLRLEPETVGDGQTTAITAAVMDTETARTSLENQPAAEAENSTPVADNDILSKVEPQPSQSKSANDSSIDQPNVVKKIKKQVAFNHMDELNAAERETGGESDNGHNKTGAASSSVEEQIPAGTGRRSSRRGSSRKKLSLRWKRT